MKAGVIVPQGWIGEYDGWDPTTAWERSVAIAKRVDSLGFESIWMYDHFHTVPQPTQEITFESFTSLAALGAVTQRVRLGHIVICAGFRNPALTAKMLSSMDVYTGGRMEVGIGAGWKRDEWDAYGYGFPSTKERLKNLGDQLEILRRMMDEGPATYTGEHASVHEAINVPRPIQRPRIPIMVGGNGPEVTWRLAARFADELNLDGMSPDEVAKALPVIRARCEEIDRDPDELRVSVHLFATRFTPDGNERVDMLGSYAELGVSRIMGLVTTSTESDAALDALAEDCREAGVELSE